MYKQIAFTLTGLSFLVLAAQPLFSADLSSSKANNSVLQLAEEEKLAHDLYAYFAQKWNHPVFEHIQQAETRHLMHFRQRMAQAQLTDPTQNLTGGKFSNEALQKEFERFKALGEQSLEAALKVGLEIEEMDIHDLTQWRQQATLPADQQLADRLIQASAHHLQAFHRNLLNVGGAYQPKHLSQADFEKYLQLAHGQGKGQGKGQGHHGNGSGHNCQ